MVDVKQPPDAHASEIPPSADEVLAELDRVLTSSNFEAGERRRALLRLIVEETLAGRADRLKGYTIATRVFGRGKSFDPQTDPVVRLEARRLRRDLDSYYVEAGYLDPVRISIPKGAYLAHFERREAIESAATTAREPAPPNTPPAPNTSGKIALWLERTWNTNARKRLLAVSIVTATVAAVVSLAWWTGRQSAVIDTTDRGPIVVVLPFQALTSTENSQYLAAGISQELISDLMRFPGFRLYTFPVQWNERLSRESQQPGSDPGASYLVSGSVRDDIAGIRVAAQLQLAETGEVLWTESYDLPQSPARLIEMERELAGKIAMQIGSPYGAVNADLENRLETPAVSSMQSYLCVLRAYHYRRTFSQAEYRPAKECLETAVQRDPRYAEAWAMLGWLHLDAGRYEFSGAGELQAEYEAAFQSASLAVSLAPDNILALKALASINHYMGRYAEGEHLSRRAVELNPNDPDTLAQLGWRLAVRGNFAEGIPILQKAIERTVNPPGWYYHLIAIDLYLAGDLHQMRRIAELSAREGSPVSQALMAIACGALGERDCTRSALQKVSGFEPLARDPGAYFRRHGATDEIADALVAGLVKAHQFAGDVRVGSDLPAAETG